VQCKTSGDGPVTLKLKLSDAAPVVAAARRRLRKPSRPTKSIAPVPTVANPKPKSLHKKRLPHRLQRAGGGRMHLPARQRPMPGLMQRFVRP